MTNEQAAGVDPSSPALPTERVRFRTTDVGNVVRKSIRTVLTRFPWLADAKSDLVQAWHRRIGRPFEREFRALPQLLSHGDLCLDVGANRGQSIDALRMLGLDLRIISFEPNPELYRRLVARYGDDDDVTLLPYGLADTKHTATLHVPSYNGYEFDGLGTLQADDADLWLRSSVYSFDEDLVQVSSHRCEIVPLDDLAFDDVAFVKLDIQGAELSALRGATACLARDRPVLMIEGPDEPIIDFLAELRYSMYDYDPDQDCLRPVDEVSHALNMFFLPDDSPRRGRD